jgi:hypothetical protein
MKKYEDMPICYAITNSDTKEFYPDPIYTDKKKGMDKLVYLAEYRRKNGMNPEPMILEELTKERYEQHQKEWSNWCSMID